MGVFKFDSCIKNEQQTELIPLLEHKSIQGGHFTGGEVKAWVVITRQVSETGRTIGPSLDPRPSVLSSADAAAGV